MTMKFDVQWIEGKGYYYVQMEGDFDLTAYEKAYRRLIESGDFPPGASILWDARGCSLGNLNARTMSKLVDLFRSQSEKRGKGKAAVVVGKELDFGLTRMFEMAYQDKISFQIRIFRSVEEADQWLVAGMDGSTSACG